MPPNHRSQRVENPTQLNANRPAAFVAVLLAQLLLRASRADRKQQFNRKAVDHIQQGRRLQEPINMILLSTQLALKRSAVRQPAEERIVVALQPAAESAKMPAFEGKQNPNRHH